MCVQNLNTIDRAMLILKIWNLKIKNWREIIILFILYTTNCFADAWIPHSSSKLVNGINQVHSIKFIGNRTHSNHFTVLNQDQNSIVLGGRNAAYNLSTHDFSECKECRLLWYSSEAHSQLCQLKGKTEDDCQNYIRIFIYLSSEVLLVCGTNSYKPLCRHYSVLNGKYKLQKELEGVGICPFNPEHNNTAVESNGSIFAATIGDFSERDPVIYREPQRTELSDLKQLNAPDFVSSMPYGDYIFFFFRETAVEYINCGKIVYSRVARVCRDDKGGPHQFSDRWTTFLKARLNCSVPGEYPFYFNEIRGGFNFPVYSPVPLKTDGIVLKVILSCSSIVLNMIHESTSDIIEGKYGSAALQQIVYGTFTTPSNAIGGSAICAYSMRDILKAFEGSFKYQENMNSNWLPISKEKIPEPRPGECMKDSRVLPENVVNFVKTHSLMEDAVPNLFGQPILVHVSLQYRFTSIAVHSQVEDIDKDRFDVLYIGTDDGRVLKVVNIPNQDSAKGVVISENHVFCNSTPVKQLKIAAGYGRVVVVSQNEVKLATLVHCSAADRCQNCVALQDPHCAWDTTSSECVSIDSVSTLKRFLIQDVRHGDGRKCWSPPTDKRILAKSYDRSNNENEVITQRTDDPFLKISDDNLECEDSLTGNRITGCAVRQPLVIYTAKTLQIIVVCSSLAALFFGFLSGYLFSRRFHPQSNYPDTPFIEQHNHLERLNGNSKGFLTPRTNKTINLMVNVPPSPSQKKDNLETKDLNIASDGTLQKIKKTYI